MKNKLSVILAIVGVSVLLLVGLAYWQSRAGGQEALADVLGVTVTPETYALGNVPIDGGLVTKEYQLANETGGVITLKKIATSCMCTQAKVTINSSESRFFGMEHGGDRNPPIRMELPAGEKAQVTVTFDPAAHGPQGVGPFERVVWLTFSDPAGIKELTFDGTVVN